MHIVWVQQFASLHCCHAGIFIAQLICLLESLDYRVNMLPVLCILLHYDQLFLFLRPSSSLLRT